MIDYYEPALASAQDYYPFGMLMPKRSTAGAFGYMYGFNGKENDNDVKSLGNQQDYGMRIYDGRLGRFLSVDPLKIKFPYYTPYNYAGNTPIWAVDLDGMEPFFTHRGNGIYGVGNFNSMELGSVKKSRSFLTIGNPGKQFEIRWLLNNDGETIGYLASRVMPEEDYKFYYGGSGKGIQDAYVIENDKFFDFGKNLDEYYDYSEKAELYDVLWGELDRSPYLSFFDPRSWLLRRVGGVTGTMSARLFMKLPLSKTLVAKAHEFIRTESLNGKADSKQVGVLMSKMKAGEKIEPIEVFEYNGRKYVLDGHHRMEAAKRMGKDIEYKSVSIEEIIKSGRFKSKEEILNAAAEAAAVPNKLSGTIVNQYSNQ